MSFNPSIYPFGSWPSPISASSVAEGALRFGRVQVINGTVYWSEGRPAENGRTTIMRWTGGGSPEELLPPTFSARSRVHEYGGGEFLVSRGAIYFVNDSCQNIYVAKTDGGITPLTDRRGTRFADFGHDARRKRLIAVAEDHGGGGEDGALPRNSLWSVSVDAEDARENGAVLLEGHGFYANPRLNPDGTKLCFLAWDLPHMPWEAAALYVADIAEDGSASTPVRLAGGEGTACFQPEWGPDGWLYFTWDVDGFGNLFRWKGEGGPSQITYLQAEISKPLWSLNAASYALLPDDRIYLSFTANGEQGCAIYDLKSRALSLRENGLTTIQTLAADGKIAAFAGLTDSEASCVCVEPIDRPGREGAEKPSSNMPFVIRRSGKTAFDPAYSPPSRRIEFANANGEAVFGIFQAPANPSARGPDDSLPPLIINLHGGPTGAAARGLKPRTLFFTSHGFAWLDLDYSGSTGYGRAYRERLRGRWGIQDVNDTIAAAEFAASSGLADRRAIFITGGSAGGYTVLMAIAASNIFRGAASYYGICDLVALQLTTHKFEQGYQSGLLGATLEEDEALYRGRSALSQIEQINTPLIVFQGVEDRVVPKEQARTIIEALRRKNLLVEYHEFAGEGHGFRKAETIQISLQAELDFYRRLMEAAG